MVLQLIYNVAKHVDIMKRLVAGINYTLRSERELMALEMGLGAEQHRAPVTCTHDWYLPLLHTTKAHNNTSLDARRVPVPLHNCL